MVGPTTEKLVTMGLLEKKESISTEVLYLRDDEKRQTYFDQFKDHNKDVEGLAGVQWGRDSTPTSNGLRFNANVGVRAKTSQRHPAYVAISYDGFI